MNQTVAIVMPYHGEARFRLASWVRLRLGALHPDWQLIVSTDGGEPWSKARAANRGVPTSADIVVICDADVAVPAKALDWAVATVADGAAWAVPFGTIYRLTRDRTYTVLGQSPAVDLEHLDTDACVRNRPPYEAVPGGGIFAVARDAWDKVGGFDPRFEWGQEDASLGHCLDTLAGPHELLPAPLWHLWHEPRVQSTQMYDDQRLEARYLAARGKAPAMRRLVRERAGANEDVRVKPA